MKNIYEKRVVNSQDDRPIPVPEDNLYNDPRERELPSEFKKVKDYYKSQNNQNNQKSEK